MLIKKRKMKQYRRKGSSKLKISKQNKKIIKDCRNFPEVYKKKQRPGSGTWSHKFIKKEQLPIIKNISFWKLLAFFSSHIHHALSSYTIS